MAPQREFQVGGSEIGTLIGNLLMSPNYPRRNMIKPDTYVATLRLHVHVEQFLIRVRRLGGVGLRV